MRNRWWAALVLVGALCSVARATNDGSVVCSSLKVLGAPCTSLNVSHYDSPSKEACCDALASMASAGCFCSRTRDRSSGLEDLAWSLCYIRSFPSRRPLCLTNSGGRDELHDSKSAVIPNTLLNSSREVIVVKLSGFQQGGGSRIFAFWGGCTFLACAFICPCFLAHKKDSNAAVRSIQTSQEATSSTSFGGDTSGVTGQGPLIFTMPELMKVTQNFSNNNKIGHGGSGDVYKGKLRDGTLVAVKRAKKGTIDARRAKEFENELKTLSNIEHLNLVKLIGYVEDRREHILVVEYVSNGNLREHLDGMYGDTLDFAKRIDVAIDVAHALTYLHLYADQPIIHRDIKSTNILLTDNFRAKVADFGFSKIGPAEGGATHVSTQVKGTAGYLDPDYLQTYKLTTKSDVYSFGILMVELFSGRRPIELRRPSEERISVRWAFKKFVEGKLNEVLDPKLERTQNVLSTFEKLAELAFQCSAPSKNERPTMKEASEKLSYFRRDFQAELSQTPTPRGSFVHNPFQSNVGPFQPNSPRRFPPVSPRRGK